MLGSEHVLPKHRDHGQMALTMGWVMILYALQGRVHMLAIEGQQRGRFTTVQPCRHCRTPLSDFGRTLTARQGTSFVSRAGLAARRQTAADLPSPAAMLHVSCVGHSPLGGMVGKLGWEVRRNGI